MAVGYKSVGFTFSITTPTSISITPTRQNVLNTFDFIGDLLSTKRLDGENNAAYKQRLMDVAVHPGGPTYEGIVNNLTREFGYTRNRAFAINLKTTSAGDTIAASPRVDILPNKVILYSDWRPNGTVTIDKTIYIYKPEDSGYFLDDLIYEINTSTCYTATIYEEVRDNLQSTNLIQGTTNNFVSGDLLESSGRINLVATYITKDSLVFNEPNIFDTEVLGTPTNSGEYYVDYINGYIYPFDLPSGQQDVSYYYQTFPFQVDYSMIKIYTLQDDNFFSQLFVQETIDSGETKNALPNTEGAEIFHQLFKETNVFWGK